jgi:hypothetical protein
MIPAGASDRPTGDMTRRVKPFFSGPRVSFSGLRVSPEVSPANPAGPRKVPEPAGPGWRVVPWDEDGVWLHIPPDLVTNSDDKEA